MFQRLLRALIQSFCNFKFTVVLAIVIDYIMAMKRSEITAVCLLGGILSGTAVKAVVTDTKDSPYDVIIQRNVFGLRPPPPIAEPTPPPKPPAAEVKLAGITTIVSPPRAILQWKDPGQPPAPGNPGTPPGKDESYIFREGEQQGIIKVLAINVKDGSVKIENAGEPMLLTFETHGSKLPNTPAPAGPPGALPNPAGGTAPGHPAALGLPPNNRFGGYPIPGAGGVNPAGSGQPSIPVRPLRASPEPATTVAQQPSMTPETQIVLMEIERERTKEAVAAGDLPPLPPTELTPETPEGQ